MNKLLDLRFVIGLFFTVVAILLLIYSFGKGEEINRWCGIVFGVFGILMILLSFGKDANDELV